MEPTTITTIPLDVQIMCVRRELRRRRATYGPLVRKGEITEAQAVKELQAMEAVLATLTALLEGRQGE